MFLSVSLEFGQRQITHFFQNSVFNCLIAFKCIHKFDIICLSESYLISEIFSSDSNLQIPGYNFARMDHPFIASESRRRIFSSRMYKL